MAKLTVRRNLLKWGNAYGIRVTRKEAAELGLGAKDAVRVVVRPEPAGIRVERLTPLGMGRHASREHDRLAREAADAGR